MSWAVPKIWQDGDVWILGGGPSVPKLFGVPKEIIQKVHSGELPESAYSPYLEFLHDKHVIGINVAYKIGDWIDMIFFGDTNFFNSYHSDLAQWRGLKVTCSTNINKKYEWVKILNRDRKKGRGITSNPRSVSWNGNSGAAAISLAVHTGAKRIFLLGFDMHYDESKNQHWHSIYKRDANDVKKNKNPFFRHLIGFKQIARDAQRMGVQIYNVCPDSAIQDLPKISLEKAIELSKIKPIDTSEQIVQKAPENLKIKGKPIEKICITTVFDRNYMEAGKTLFNSIKRHTDCTGIDFKVITADTEVVNAFGKENCHFITDAIKDRYKNVAYSSDLPVEKYSTSWYRYEIFNMTEYNRVICIDSDCICIEDIAYLFGEELNEYDLISVEDHIVSKCFNRFVPDLEKRGLRLKNLMKRFEEGKIDIQPALLVANKTIINKEFYKKLLKYANTAPFSYSIDEGVLNDFIYMEGIKIKLLPLEWDYQDIYGLACPDLPVPLAPVIVHCQESKPFKKKKEDVDVKLHKWYDLWVRESKPIQEKTIVVIIVWNRFENLRRWINCWKQCDQMGADLIVIHNQENDNHRYWKLCDDNGIRYVYRENAGFDVGAFQDVCKERLDNFPNDWDNMIWVTDDCIPMAKDFVGQFLNRLSDTDLPCYEISDQVKRHIRTTGFMVTKEIAKKLTFPRDPIYNREDCYQFEHKGWNMYEQIVSMGKRPVMVTQDLKKSPLWDSGVRRHLKLMAKHEAIFPPVVIDAPVINGKNILDEIAITHKSDKSSRYHNYAIKYDKILHPFRDSFSSVLEIGVAQGQSVKMWTDYFPNATIHGADISEASKICEAYSNRIKFHLLDQRDEAQLKNLEQFSPFDFIIDDGSHFWMEQILTFNTLFPYVKSGGIYIVEDTTTSYWKEYKNNTISPVEFFKTLVDEVHLRGERGRVPLNPPQEFKDWEKGWHRREDCHENVPLFESIQFMNGFIVIYKQ